MPRSFLGTVKGEDTCVMSEAHLVLWESSQLSASLRPLHLPLKERCRSRACPRASCTFSIRALHAPEERAGPEWSGWGSTGHLPPITPTPDSPSKLSASTLNPSSLLISKRRCGPARLGAWFSLSSGDGGSSSELEASPGPKQQVRAGEDHPSWSPKSRVPHPLPQPPCTSRYLV